MGESLGILAAILSSSLGGAAVSVTRFVIHETDPFTLGAFRFGIGFVFLLPTLFFRRHSWPTWLEWPAITALGLLFFFLFPILFNVSLAYTTAARGALVLSTLPILTMVVGAALGAEALTFHKSAGVLLAFAGVAVALVTGLAVAPAGAWRGDLLMFAAAFCMALYNIWSKPLIHKLGPLGFTTMAMGAGASALVALAFARGGLAASATFRLADWLAVSYLGVVGSAVVFFLWAFALSRTTPTKVAISVTLNPITASMLGAYLLHESIGWNVTAGMVSVFLGIWLTTRKASGAASHGIRNA